MKRDRLLVEGKLIALEEVEFQRTVGKNKLSDGSTPEDIRKSAHRYPKEETDGGELSPRSGSRKKGRQKKGVAMPFVRQAMTSFVRQVVTSFASQLVRCGGYLPETGQAGRRNARNLVNREM